MPVPDALARQRTVAWAGLALYVLVVASLTFTPHAATGQLLAFHDQLQDVLDVVSLDHLRVSVDGAQALANVVLFVPFGLLGRLALPRLPATILLLLAAAGSTGIELVQYVLLPDRVPSLVDVLTNTAGAAFGLVLGVDVERLLTARRAQVGGPSPR